MRLRWKREEIPFSFVIGDRRVFVSELTLQTCPVGLTVQPIAEPELPQDPLEEGCAGFFIRRLPIKCEQPPIRCHGDYICYVPTQDPRHYIDLTQSFDDYQQKFSSKTRSTIRRKVRRFAEYCGGNIQYKTYKTAEEIEEFHQLARMVSAKSYQEKSLGTGIPQSQEFVRSLQTLAAEGQLRGYVIFHRQRPVAYLCCPAHEGILEYEYLGYDPDYMQWSVGTILLWHAVEQIFAEASFKVFDFVGAQSDQARLFATHHVQCANVYFLKRNLLNSVLVRSHWFVSKFSRIFGNFLGKLGLKTRTRMLMRFGLMRSGSEDALVSSSSTKIASVIMWGIFVMFDVPDAPI